MCIGVGGGHNISFAHKSGRICHYPLARLQARGDFQQGTAAHGLEFIDPKPNDTMLLQSMVYQQIIEQPMAVI